MHALAVQHEPRAKRRIARLYRVHHHAPDCAGVFDDLLQAPDAVGAFLAEHFLILTLRASGCLRACRLRCVRAFRRRQQLTRLYVAQPDGALVRRHQRIAEQIGDLRLVRVARRDAPHLLELAQRAVDRKCVTLRQLQIAPDLLLRLFPAPEMRIRLRRRGNMPVVSGIVRIQTTDDLVGDIVGGHRQWQEILPALCHRRKRQQVPSREIGARRAPQPRKRKPVSRSGLLQESLADIPRRRWPALRGNNVELLVDAAFKAPAVRLGCGVRLFLRRLARFQHQRRRRDQRIALHQRLRMELQQPTAPHPDSFEKLRRQFKRRMRPHRAQRLQPCTQLF